MPLVDLRLNAIALGEQLAILGHELREQLGELRLQNFFRRNARARQCLLLDERFFRASEAATERPARVCMSVSGLDLRKRMICTRGVIKFFVSQ